MRDATFLLEVWELVSENIDDRKKYDVICALIGLFEDQGYDIDDIKKLRGDDKYIDQALDDMFGDEDDEEEDDY